MRKLPLPFLFAGLFFPLSALSQEWKNECVGYYQLQLPDNVEVALYPVNDFIKPRIEPVIIDGIKVQRHAKSGITFDRDHYIQADINKVQAQFSAHYYGKYKLGLSSQHKKPIDFPAYRQLVKDNKDFRVNVARQTEENDFRFFHEPVTPKSEFDRIHGYIIKDYVNAFSLYEDTAYTLYINEDNRLYHFWKEYEEDTGDKSQTAEKQWRDKEPEVLSLLKRFRARKLYEVPAEQGFCLPYGFIAGDSGQEKRNMAVTFRLKEHPDVSIFFQDLGTNPGPGKERPDPKINAKDYVTYFWNVEYGHSFRDIKLHGKGFSSPDMDNRQAVAAFAKFTRYDKVVDYGYVAMVKGRKNSTEPDLLFYVMRDSRQVKDHPPMDKDELEKMAEHIISTVKRR